MEGINRKLEKKPKSIVEKLEQIFKKENFSENEVFELMGEFYEKNKNCNSKNNSEFQEFSRLIENNDPEYCSGLEIGDIDNDGFRTLYTKSWSMAFSMEMIPGKVLRIPYFIKLDNEKETINPFWDNLKYYRNIE